MEEKYGPVGKCVGKWFKLNDMYMSATEEIDRVCKEYGFPEPKEISVQIQNSFFSEADPDKGTIIISNSNLDSYSLDSTIKHEAKHIVTDPILKEDVKEGIISRAEKYSFGEAFSYTAELKDINQKLEEGTERFYSDIAEVYKKYKQNVPFKNPAELKKYLLSNPEENRRYPEIHPDFEDDLINYFYVFEHFSVKYAELIYSPLEYIKGLLSISKYNLPMETINRNATTLEGFRLAHPYHDPYHVYGIKILEKSGLDFKDFDEKKLNEVEANLANTIKDKRYSEFFSIT